MTQVTRRRRDGTFAPGQSGNPSGRPAMTHWRRQAQQHYLEILQGELDDETWRGIVRAAIRDSLAGSNVARAWLARYCLPSESTLEIMLAQQQTTTIRVVYGQPDSKLAIEGEQWEVIEGE